MPVTTFARWKGGNPTEIVEAAKQARTYHIKHGAEAVRLSRYHSGPFVGEWLVVAHYRDWTTYGKAVDGMTNDAEYQALVGRVMGIAQMVDRSTLVEYSLD